MNPATPFPCSQHYYGFSGDEPLTIVSFYLDHDWLECISMQGFKSDQQSILCCPCPHDTAAKAGNPGVKHGRDPFATMPRHTPASRCSCEDLRHIRKEVISFLTCQQERTPMMSSLSDMEECVWCTAFHCFSTACEAKLDTEHVLRYLIAFHALQKGRQSGFSSSCAVLLLTPRKM